MAIRVAPAARTAMATSRPVTAGGQRQARDDGGGGEQRGQAEQGADDGGGQDVEPARVDQRPEDLAVVAQQQQEHGRAGQQDPGQGLDGGGQQAERHLRDEHDRGGGQHAPSRST
jgi:hypothetical protein